MIEVIPIGWTVRYNGDGHSFDAGCLVTHCLNNTVEVHLGMSLSPKAFVKFRIEMKQHFTKQGYKVSRWMRNGKVIEEELK